MIDTATSLVIKASRLKGVPIPIMNACLFVLWYFLLSRISAGFHYPGIMAIVKARPIFALPFIVIVGMGLYSIGLLMRPPSLTLTSTGWTIKGLMRSETHDWSDYGEPRIGYLAGGRAGYNVIKVPKIETDDVAIIPYGIYKIDGEDVFQAVKRARAGETPKDYQNNFPMTYVIGWIPITICMFMATLAWFYYMMPKF